MLRLYFEFCESFFLTDSERACVMSSVFGFSMFLAADVECRY